MRIKHAVVAMGLMVGLVGYCLSLDSNELLGLRAQGMDYQTNLEPTTLLIGAGVAADPFGRAGG